jgi:carbamate kinase
MRLLVALGGNALLRRGEPVDTGTQRRNARAAARALAPVIAGHRVVITHGNGPQVGLLAERSAAAGRPAEPLDVLGAESEGIIGYLLAQELVNECPNQAFVTLLTMVEVDADDPAFGGPTKPIGPVYGRAAWQRIAAASGWQGARDGAGWRRVVPSPQPVRIVEADVIARLAAQGVVPICAGGGGIPVVRDGGRLRGVEAVIDKDLTSARLAAALDADLLFLLTDVDAVYRRWGAGDAEPVPVLTAADLDGLDLPAGSMGPKVAAALAFARATGREAVIGRLGDADALARGAGGTRVRAG